MLRERSQVRRHRVHEGPHSCERFLLDIDFHRGGCWSENARSWGQNPTYGAASRDAGVVQETWINLDATLCLWSADSLLDRGDFLWTQARLAPSFLARQYRRIK